MPDDIYTATDSNGEPLSLTLIQPEPEYLVSFHGENNEMVVGIKPDGTVVIAKEGAAPEAARIFYMALEIEGLNLYGKIGHLESEVSIQKARVRELEQTLADAGIRVK